jgi:transposase InsO family protein
VKYGFMFAHLPLYPLRLMCRVLGASKSGFLHWRHHPRSAHAERDAGLTEQIISLHQEHRGVYGSPRVHQALRHQGERVSRKRVARLMREAGLSFVPAAIRVITTDSNHDSPIAENVLHRDFSATAPNQKWVTDITYIRTDEGWLYLSAIVDLFSRKVIGWAMESTMATTLVAKSLNQALANRRPDGELIHHSDRGSQYAGASYREKLEQAGITISMSRRGNCHDNACAESFWARLKVELVYRRTFATREDARRAIFEYIEVFYNRIRLHSALGHVSPDSFEKSYHAQPSST